MNDFKKPGSLGLVAVIHRAMMHFEGEAVFDSDDVQGLFEQINTYVVCSIREEKVKAAGGAALKESEKRQFLWSRLLRKLQKVDAMLSAQEIKAPLVVSALASGMTEVV